MGMPFAPEYQARNSATGELLAFKGRPVTGSYTWVAAHIEALISEGNRPAYVIEEAT